MILLAAFLGTGMVLAPPRRCSTGGSDAWGFGSLSLQEAADTMDEFSRTYADPPPVFVCRPLPHPQGFASFCRNEDVRLVLHFVEMRPERYSITHICMRDGETEAPRQLFAAMATTTQFQFDPVCFNTQPRWRMMAQYYMDW